MVGVVRAGTAVALPSAIDQLLAVQVAIWLFILTLVVGVVAKLWRPAKRFIRGVDTLFGTGEQDALDERLHRIEATQTENTRMIDVIHREVLPNHGSSLRDQVDGVSRRVDAIAEYQKRDYVRLQAHLVEAEDAKVVIEQLTDTLDGEGVGE